MPRAIVLFSGGLDSCLASLILLRQGIEVIALRFITPFGCTNQKDLKGFLNIVRRYNFWLLDVDIYNEFIEIVKKPSFGYGKNMNPCIDCKILMLKKAGEMRKHLGADLIATGEVLGQRPMSQQRHIFNLMEKETGLKGQILRPLSAHLLTPTLAEQKGIVDRASLMGITGRGRRQQIELASKFGLDDYAPPSGGCLLTEPNFAFRLRELFTHTMEPSRTEIDLLRYGRHFRLPSGAKVIVGRNQDDNERLLALSGDSTIIEPCKVKGPMVLLIASDTKRSDLLDAGSLCARYADHNGDIKEIEVLIRRGSYKVEQSLGNVQRGKELERYMIKINNG